MKIEYPFMRYFLLSALLLLVTGRQLQGQCTNTQLGGQSGCARSATTVTVEIAPTGGTVPVSVSPYSPGTYFRMPVLAGGCYSVSTCGNSIDTQINCFQGLSTTAPFAYDDDSGPQCAGLQASCNLVPNFTDYARIDVRQYSCLPGGSSSITVSVWQNNNLSITSSGAALCEGQVRTLTATPLPVSGAQPNSGSSGAFSGTGVSGSTFTGPTPAGQSQAYTVTYSFGYCTTTQSITVFHAPSASVAGSNQTVCSTTATLGATAPAFGSGVWSVVSGTGTVTIPTSPTSTVTGLTAGATTVLQWTVSNGPCATTSSTVSITVANTPTVANAGPDQTVCATSTALAGNTPTVGTGAWSIIAGAGGTVTTPSSPTSTFTGVAGTTYTLRWTISNAPCTASTDDVIVTLQANPTASGAGFDQNVCGTTATLGANTPTVGTGAWSIVSGAGGTVTTPTSPNSTFTGVPGTTYTLRWTISNAPCTPSTDDVLISLAANPSTSNAGPDQTVCATTATLAGNTPTSGSGAWSIVSGAGGTVTTPSDPASTFTGVAGTTYTLRWSITNPPCAASTDDVVITMSGNPTTADAGPDQSVCGTSTALAGNTPTTGTGAWSIVSGAGGSVITPSSPTSAFTGVVGTTYTLRWTISNAPCSPSTDDVEVTMVDNPTVSNAGPDQSGCLTTVNLAANTPTSGTGVWTILAGTGGTVTTPSDPTSTFTGTVGQTYTLRWTITNPPCSPSSDNVLISITNTTTTSNAGPDQVICGTTATLAANTPVVGTGSWSIVSGTGGTVTTPSDPASTFTATPGQVYTLRWTIDNPPCSPSIDDVVISTDVVPPTITCPANSTAASGSGVCTLPVTYTPPVGNDNCPGPVTTQTAGLASGATFTVGTTVNTYQVTDATGNTASCSFSVTITDNQPPAAICQNVSVQLNGSGTGTTTATAVDNGSTDNCAVGTYSLSQTTFVCAEVGSNTEVLTVTDVNGNTSTCTATVTVQDVTPPTATCQNATVQLDANGTGSVLPATIGAGSTDECGTPTFSMTQNAYGCIDLGTNTEVLTVTDAGGNTSTCNAVITVEDQVAPTAVCQSITVTLDANGDGTASATAVGSGSTDNCSGSTLALVPTAYTCADLGTNTAILTVTDGSTNTSTCNATVTVEDQIAPAVTCPGNISLQANSSTCDSVATWVAPSGTDNCSVASTNGTHTPGSTFAVGTTTVVYTATDGSGNTGTCSFTVTVNVSPLLVSVSSPVQGCGFHLACASDSNAVVTSTVTGGCLPYTYSWSTGDVTPGLTGMPAGSYDLTVTDNRGTAVVATMVITAPAPLTATTTGTTILCQGISNGTATVVATGGQNCTLYDYLWSTGDVTDVVSGLAAGTYTVTVTDTLGCSTTATHTIQSGTAASVSVGANVSTCPGVPVTVTATGSFASLLWSTGSTNASISATPGTYSVTATSVDGCEAADTIVVGAFTVDNDIITPSGSLSICDGETLQLAGDAGLTNYLWSTGATTTSISVTGAGGPISLSATDANGCAVHDTVVVVFTPWTDPLPVITPGPTVAICDGSSVTLDAGTYSGYAWSTGATTQTITVTAAGSYQVTVSNAGGCTKVSSAVTVTVNPNPTPTIVLNTGTLSTTQSYASYQWLLNGSPVSGATSATFTPTVGGTYSVTVTDANGCTGTSNDLLVDPTAIGEALESLTGLTLYPNPSQGQLKLRTVSPIDWPMEIEVWDMFGKKVRTFKMAHLMDVASFDLSGIAAGPYMMKVTSFERTSTRQAVIRFVLE